VLCEGALKHVLSGVERQVAHIQSIAHLLCLLSFAARETPGRPFDPPAPPLLGGVAAPAAAQFRDRAPMKPTFRVPKKTREQ
jgi:hypothetical protein